MNRIRSIFAVVAIVALSTILTRNCVAAIWYVEADGSGDFATIQLAVDAAESGDVVQLGDGVFDDYVTAPSAPFREVYVKITTDNLTIRGAGAGNTIIGQVVADMHSTSHVVVVEVLGISRVRFEDLTLQLRDWPGTLLVCGTGVDLAIEDCEFRDAQNGIQFRQATGVDIRNCVFSDLDWAAIVGLNVPGIVQNCRFERVGLGLHTRGPGLLVVEECDFDGGNSGSNSSGAYVTLQGYCEFRNCTFRNHTRAGILVAGVQTTLNGCEIYESQGHGLEVTGGSLKGTGNIIYSESIVLVLDNDVRVEFTNNQFLTSGSGLLAKAYRESAGPFLFVVDLANNWWGTDDSSEIATRIWDSVDDKKLRMRVNYLPFYGGPVAVENRAWGDLKAMYR